MLIAGFLSQRSKTPDYLFSAQKVVIELKIIEAESGDTEAFALKGFALLRDMGTRFGSSRIPLSESCKFAVWAAIRFTVPINVASLAGSPCPLLARPRHHV